MKSKILVTGGAGFIGSNVVKALYERGYSVNVLDNCSVGNKIAPSILSDIRFFKADVRDLDSVVKAAAGCETIIHFAAVVGVDEVIKRRSETISTEALGAQNVGKAAIINGIKKVIYSSSSGVYNNTKPTKSQETDDLHLINDYTIAKRLNELYFEALAQENGITTYVLRFFNVYGANQDTRMVIPRFLKQALTGQPIEVFGNGQQTRDFTFIKDVNEYLVRFLEKTVSSGIYNLSTGVETPIIELAHIIQKITASTSTLQLLPFPKQRIAYKINKRVGCSEKIRSALKYIPQTTLEEGLMALANQIQQEAILQKPSRLSR